MSVLVYSNHLALYSADQQDSEQSIKVIEYILLCTYYTVEVKSYMD